MLVSVTTVVVIGKEHQYSSTCFILHFNNYVLVITSAGFLIDETIDTIPNFPFALFYNNHHIPLEKPILKEFQLPSETCFPNDFPYTKHFSTLLIFKQNINFKDYEIMDVFINKSLNVDDNGVIVYSDSSIGKNIMQKLYISTTTLLTLFHLNQLQNIIVQPSLPRNPCGSILLDTSMKTIYGMVILTQINDNSSIILPIHKLLECIELNSTIIEYPIYKISFNCNMASCCCVYSNINRSLLVASSHFLESKFNVPLVYLPTISNPLQPIVKFYSWCLDIVILELPIQLQSLELIKSNQNIFPQQVKLIGCPSNSDDLILQLGCICGCNKKNNENLIYCTSCTILDGLSGGALLQNGKMVGMGISGDSYSYCLSGNIIQKVINLVVDGVDEENILISLMDYGVIDESIENGGEYYDYEPK